MYAEAAAAEGGVEEEAAAEGGVEEEASTRRFTFEGVTYISFSDYWDSAFYRACMELGDFTLDSMEVKDLICLLNYVFYTSIVDKHSNGMTHT